MLCPLKGTNTQRSGHMDNKKSKLHELVVGMYSKSLVRAIGKVLLEHQLKPTKVMKNGLCLLTNSCYGGPHQ